MTSCTRDVSVAIAATQSSALLVSDTVACSSSSGSPAEASESSAYKDKVRVVSLNRGEDPIEHVDSTAIGVAIEAVFEVTTDLDRVAEADAQLLFPTPLHTCRQPDFGLVNEINAVAGRMGIDTHEVINAADPRIRA